MVSGEEVVVIVGLMLFGEMKLPLYLRRRGAFWWPPKKGEPIGGGVGWGALEQENSSISPT